VARDVAVTRTPGPVLVLFGALLGAARPLAAQQYITDDAGLTEYRACQIQMWHGQRASWVLPVCTPVRNLELSVGFIALWKRGGGDGHFEYVLQGKTLFRPLRPNDWGAGLAVGTGRDPALASTNPELHSYYAYVPLSLSLAGDRVVLHQNTGWLYQRAGDEADWHGRHALTWAARADVALGGPRRPAMAVVEAYGAEGTARAAPEFQVGLRAFPRPKSVQVDLSWGGYLRTGKRAAGWTLGLTLVTPPFL
jgi:hypothetical protein